MALQPLMDSVSQKDKHTQPTMRAFTAAAQAREEAAQEELVRYQKAAEAWAERKAEVEGREWTLAQELEDRKHKITQAREAFRERQVEQRDEW